MHKKIQEHSMRIITITFVVIILLGVIGYVILQNNSPRSAQPTTSASANDVRMAILSQKSNIPDINPKLSVAERLKMMSQPAKTINVPIVPKIKK